MSPLPEHQCVDCAKLPPLPDDESLVDEDVEYRPRTPRPAPYGGPRSRQCSTHRHARRKATRTRKADWKRATVYGLDRDAYRKLWELQGNACPCGRQPTREPDTDHDHALAREHDHPTEHACPLCLRGLCCRSCNTWILGRYNADQLRALAAYLDDPPMARLLREAL